MKVSARLVRDSDQRALAETTFDITDRIERAQKISDLLNHAYAQLPVTEVTLPPFTIKIDKAA